MVKVDCEQPFDLLCLLKEDSKMRRLIAFLSLILAIANVSAGAENVKLVASAPSSVSVGSRFQVVYNLNVDASASSFRLPEVVGINLLMGPSVASQQSFSSVNGNVTRESSTVFTYVFLAPKEGTFTVPAASIVVDGKKITSNTLTINVSKSAQQPQSSVGQDANTSVETTSDDDVFVTQTLNKSSVFVGEAAVKTTKIYTRAALKSISDVKLPALSEFVVHDLDEVKQLSFSVESVNGKTYHVATYDTKLLLPQKAGSIKIEPIEFEFVVEERVSRRPRSIFDMFDDARLVKKSVKSKALTLNVKPFPAASKPASFAGAVGNFKLNALLSQQSVAVDEGVTLKIELSGEGNFRTLDIPKPTFHSDFDTFDANVKNNFTPSIGGGKGSKSFEYLFIPRRAGKFTIPAIEFSYFNPQSGKYVTLSKGPFEIEVEKGTGTPSGPSNVSFAGSGSREHVQYLGKDMRFIKNNDLSLFQRGEFFLGSLLFWILTILPIVLFGILVSIYRKRIKDNADISRVKNRRANKLARKRLKKASKLCKDGKREAFYDEVMRAMWGYLSDKLLLPISDLTKDNAKAEMVKHSIPDEEANEFMAMLDACEFARYAPASATESMDELYGKVVDLISKIDGYIK